MSRRAEHVLEFDKLRELLRQRTTCAPGRRFVDGLESNGSREDLESAFALIREAREWLRLGRELGFGASRGPAGLDGPAGIARCGARSGGFSGCGIAAGDVDVAAPAISGRSGKISAAGSARRGSLLISRNCTRRSGDAFCRTARSATMLRARCVAFAPASCRRAIRFRKR